MRQGRGKHRIRLDQIVCKTHIFTVQNLTYVTAETVCELLRLLAEAHPGMPITLGVNNARLTEVRSGTGVGSEPRH